MHKPKTSLIKIGEGFPPNPLGEIGKNPTTEECAAHDASETAMKQSTEGHSMTLRNIKTHCGASWP